MSDGDGSSELIVRIIDHLKNKGVPGGLKYWILGGLILVLAILGGGGSFFSVGTEEMAVVLRFGKATTPVGPGLHFKLPFGIDEVHLVKTGRIFKEEFGFRTVRVGTRTEYDRTRFDDESLTLTGDLNVSDLEWIVQFQVTNPEKYLFRIKEPEQTIRDLAESVVRKVVGNSNVTDVLTTERAVLAEAMQKELQETLNKYDVGIRIVTLKFQDVNPPESVKAAFNEVNEAEQQKESLIQQAREQYNKEVPRARGVARQTIQEAEGYALERINKAKGETSRFLALLAEYQRAPEVTRRRLFLETLEEVLPRVTEVYLIDQIGGGAGVLPHLPLRSEPVTEVKP
jgi:modulator of FtsH protease HflK